MTKLWWAGGILLWGILTVTEIKAEEAKEAPATTESKKSDPKKNSKDSGPKKPEEEESKQIKGAYVLMPPFRIPVIQNRIHKSNILIEIVLEAPSMDKALKMAKARPLIVDAVLVDLYSVFAIVWHPNFHVELVDLKERLRSIVLKVVDKDLLKDVWVQSYTTQLNIYDALE